MIEKTFLSYKPIMQYIPKTLYGLTKYHSFIKYIAENGNYICAVDGKIVSRDEGNQIFRELKRKHPNCKIEKEICHLNNDEIINYIDGQIDKYANYIDDYNQYRSAMDANEQLYDLIQKFKSIC